ncbi:T9SS type A sorting domain-containing protein [bacterium]|nr:T9SS type A sorting domain-containing protein [bacterium]
MLSRSFATTKPLSLIVLLFGLSLLASTQANAQATWYSQGTNAFSTLANWNSSPGGGGSNPTAGDLTDGNSTFIIQGSDIITVDQNLTVDSIEVQSSGTLRFDDNGPYTVTLNADFINDGTVNITNPDANSGFFIHVIDLNADFVNSGTFDGSLVTGSAPNNIAISATFTSSTQSQLIDISAGTVTFNNLTINNSFGTVSTGSIGITVGGALTISSNFTLGTGNITLNGNVTKNGGTLDATTNSSTLIFSGSGNRTVTINTDQTFNNITLNKSSGSFTFAGSGGTRSFQVNGTFTRTVGSLSLSSATFRYGASGRLVYDGGSITVGNEWPTSSSDAPSQIRFAPNANATYTFNSTYPVPNNGYITVDGTSGDPSLTGGAGGISYGTGTGLIYNGTNTHTVGKEWISTHVVDSLVLNNSGNITVSSGRRFIGKKFVLTNGELKQGIAGDTLYVGGSLVGGLIGGGVYDTTNKNGTLVFNGNTRQTISGSATVYRLHVNKSGSNDTLEVQASAIIVRSWINVVDGVLLVGGGASLSANDSIVVNSGATFAVSTDPSAVANPGLLKLVGTGRYATGGKAINADTLSLALTSTLVFNGIGLQETMPDTNITFGNIEMANASGLKVAIGRTVVVAGDITFTANGKLQTGSLNSAGTLELYGTVSGSNSSRYIDGPLRRRITNNSSYSYPVGRASSYRPANFQYQNFGGGSNEVIEIEYLNTAPPGQTNEPSGVISISGGGYYTVKSISGTRPTSKTLNITLRYTDSGFMPDSRNRIVRQIAASTTDPAYELLTGETLDEPNDDITVNGVSDIPTNDGVFAFGAGGATVKWDNGQGDGLWTSQLNWDGNTVPGSLDSVVLDNSIVTGNYTVTLSGTTAQNVLALTIGDDGANTVALNITNTNGTPLSFYHATSLTGLRVLSDGTLTINGTTGGLGFINNAGVNFENSSTFNITTGTGFSTSGAQVFGATSNTTISSTTVSADVKGSNFGNLTLSPSSGTLNWDANFQAQGNVTVTIATVVVNTDATPQTASIGGNLNANGGTFTLNNGSADQDLTITGNISVAGGVLNLTTSSGSGNIGATNLNISSGTFRMVNGGGGSPVLTLSGDYNQTNGTFTSISAGTPTLNVAGNFTASGGTFTHTNGAFVFNGNSQQTINSAATFNNLTFNNTRAGMNPDDIDVLANLTVNGTLTLTDGIVDMNANIMILNAAAVSTVAGSTSFVNGQMRRFFSNTANNLTFHTGKDTLYRPVTISGTVTGNPHILVNQIEIGNFIPLTTGLSGALVKVSRIRNWQVTYTANGGTFATPIVTLSYNNAGRQTTSDGVYPITGAAVATDVSIAHQPNQTGLWLDLEGNLVGTFTNGSSGTVASVNALAFVSGQTDLFTFGATNSDVSLPVELSQFEAYEMEKLGQVKLQWKTESEVDNAYWLVQRKKGNADFETIANIKGQGSKTSATMYEFVDLEIIAGDTLTYRLADVSYAGTITYHESKDVAVSMPSKFELLQNYPNPFNPVTTIGYKLPQSTKVSISVYNVLGQKVRDLVREVKDAGTHRVVWDGRNDAGVQVASGIYIYRLEAGQFRTTRKMFFIK